MMLLLLGVHSECLVQQRRSTLSDDVTVVGGSIHAWCSNEEARFQMMLLLSGVQSECLVQQRRSTLSDYVTVVGGSLRMPGAATEEHAFR